MERSRGSVLVVDNDRAVVDALVRVLRTGGYAVDGVGSGEEALERLAVADVDVVLLDVSMPGMDGLAALARIKERWPDIEVLMVSGHHELQLAVDAVRLGALDYLAKDALTATALPPRIEGAIGHRRQQRELLRLRDEVARSAPPAMVFGPSAAMREVDARAHEWALLASPVLVHGESGTGKGTLARRIHGLSPRAPGPFVSLRLGTVPPDRLEETVFGRGAGRFGSASPSQFELADGGTLFLDDVAALPAPLQARLLQYLETGRIVRVDGTRAIPADVRVVAGSRYGPAALAGHLGGNVAARLAALPLRLPPLRERLEDLPALFEHFLRLHAGRSGRPALRVEAECFPTLRAYGWPGNVGELETVAAWMVSTSRSGVIRPGDVPFEMAVPRAAMTGLPDADGLALDQAVTLLERHLILRALERSGWNRKVAAGRLGLAYSTMKKKIRHHGLAPEEEED